MARSTFFRNFAGILMELFLHSDSHTISFTVAIAVADVVLLDFFGVEVVDFVGLATMDSLTMNAVCLYLISFA